jgi:hypothetical protein
MRLPDFPASLDSDRVILQITTYEATQNPNFRLIHHGYLKEGPKSYKVAVMFEVIDQNTGDFHHYNLDIYSIQRRKAGWFLAQETKFSLNGENGEIDALFKFLSLFNSNSAPSSTGTFYAAPMEEAFRTQSLEEDNIPELIQSILENPESYDELIKAGGKELLMRLASVATEQGEAINIISDLIGSINELESFEKIHLLTAIKNQNLTESDLNIISGRVDGLELYRQKLFEDSIWNESDWQAFFEQNTWIFGYGLDYKFLKILQREASVSSTTTAGRESVTADFLMGDTNFTTLVELKRPDTALFKNSQNRSGSWKLSDELIDATSQILEQKAEWQIKSRSLQFDGDGNPIRQVTIDPKAILIIGNTDEFAGDTLQQKIKAETFEQFRRNMRNIEIFTYDEIYERAKFIISNK